MPTGPRSNPTFSCSPPKTSRLFQNAFKRLIQASELLHAARETPNGLANRRALLLRASGYMRLLQRYLPPQVSSFNGDNVCLDLAVHSTPPEPLADSLRRDVGCFAKPRGIAGLDLICERCSLTVRDRRDPGGRCPTARRDRVNSG